jgi:eukaryotic-like serine/threonine-protein kinase
VNTSERWARVKELFDLALEREAGERAAFLAGVCEGDEALRAEVETLVRSHEDAGRFLVTGQPGGFLERGEGEPSGVGRAGPYWLLDLIGRGGMGDVYRAVRDDDHFKKIVAVKLVRPDAVSDVVLGRFRAERQILAGLEHPGIARLLDGGATEDGRPFLVMEYVEGTRIDAYVASRRLNTRVRLELFRSVCAAVQYAHQNLVVHRDLKPANILVAPEGTPKLLDFGVAKLLDPALAGEATATLFAPLTPAYASPEQVRGESITTASDVYSLGVVLYELLTGRRPHVFLESGPLALQRAICEQEPDRPSLVARSLPADVDHIVLKALRKEPAHRYATAEALAEDVRRHLEGLPVLARKGTVGYRAGKFVRRNRAAVFLGTAVLALVVGFAVTMAIQARRLAQERDKAQRVTAVLLEVFRLSDPGQTRGTAVTAREVLDRGTARIRGELEEQPEVRATLLDTMGRAYSGLGLYEQAAPLLREALETRRQVLGNEHADVLATLNALGNLQYDQGDYPAAERTLREALVLKRKTHGSEHAEVARALNSLASVRLRLGDARGAQGLYREGLDMRRRVLGPEHPDVARSLHNLALVANDLGDLAQAEALHRESLALKRRIHGEAHADVARGMTNLALVLYSKGDLGDSVALLREGLERQRRLLGSEHPDVARSLNNLANALLEHGDYPEAESLYRESVAIGRKALGGEHAELAISLDNLGCVLTRRGEPAAAVPLHREALAMRRKLLGAEHPHVANNLGALADALYALGDDAGAESLHREALAMRRKLLGDDHVNVSEGLNGLIEVLRGRGRLAEAEALARQGLAVCRKSQPQGGLATRKAVTSLALALADQGRWGEAEEAAREALQGGRQLPPGSPELAEAENVLGAALAATRRSSEAELLLRRSLEALGTHRGATSRVTREAAARAARGRAAGG